MKIIQKLILSIIFILPLSGQDPHLVLYFDVNKTLIASDLVQNKSTENILNELLAYQFSSCWDETVQAPISYSNYIKQMLPTGLDDETLDKLHGSQLHHFIDYLRANDHPFYQEASELFNSALQRLSSSPHGVFPAFYHLLDELDEKQLSYTIILRSYGSEIFELAERINDVVKPLFNHSGSFKNGILSVGDQKAETHPEIYHLLHSLSHVAVRDDYQYWKTGNFRSQFGKPFLLDQYNLDVLDIFFDDGIRLTNQDNNIIAPIDIHTGKLIPIQELDHSGQVVRVNTLECILNDDYFSKYVQKALQIRKMNEAYDVGEQGETWESPYDVGELGEAWEFPSDHLPIGASIDQLHIACWNILNKDYLGYIEMNTQGLKNSSILRDNTPVNENNTLTLREENIGKHILEMISHPTHPRSLIALQETHADVIESLKTLLPTSWAVLPPPDQPDAQDIFIYDTQVFELLSSHAIRHKKTSTNNIFTVTLQDKTSGNVYRFIQSHIPGGPHSPVGCEVFANEVLDQYDDNLTIILMGDMNQPPSVVEKAIAKAAEERGIPQPYRPLVMENPTHVNTHWQASWIDNFFAFSPDDKHRIQASQDPKELFDALEPIVDLFKKLRM